MTTSSLHAAELGQLSKALQTLHGQLLEFQAFQSGFVGGPLALFDLASKDSAFAWLKPLREAIVQLDERRADPTPLANDEREDLCRTVHSLLEAKEGAYRANLNAAFQHNPETIWTLSIARSAANSFADRNLETAA